MRSRLRAVWATVGSAPWRRAPWLLRRQLGVAATVVGASAVLAASLAAVPLFLSSVASASVALQAEERCGPDTGATRLDDTPVDELAAPAPDPFRPVADRLGPSSWWGRIQLLSLSSPGGAREQVSLLTRDGALDDVELLDVAPGGADGGVWITDRAAEGTGLGVGDTARIADVEVPVTAVYRDLSGAVVPEPWCSHADLLLIQVVGGDLLRPPPVVLADRDVFATVAGGLDVATVRTGWEAPLRPGLTLAQADDLASTLACRGPDAAALAWCVDGQPEVPRRTGGLSRNPVPARDDADFVQRFLGTALPFVLQRARSTQASVSGGIWPVAALASLAGVGLVAAATALWSDRRRRDLTLLGVRGVSPLGIGSKAVLELAIPLVVGGALGVALARLAVGAFGPSPAIETSALAGAGRAALVAVALGAATVLAVAATRARATSPRRRSLRLVLVPWEALLLAATIVSSQRLGRWGVPVGRGADVTRADAFGLLFPVLFLVTAVVVIARIAAFVLPRLRGATARWPSAAHLAVRRIAHQRAAAIGLAAAACLATGVLGYAATMNRSLDATLRAKAATYVGSDLAVVVPDADQLPAELARTEVEAFDQAWLALDDGRESVAVRAIDPETFANAAFWDDGYADAPLREVLRRLRPDGDGPVPAVVVGADVGAVVEVGVVSNGTRRIEVAPIDGVEAFPGMSRPRPTVFVAAEVLDDPAVRGRPEVWLRGDPDDTVAALAAAGVQFELIRTVTDVADRSSFVTVSWTFGFLQWLGVVAGILVVGGVAVHLDARHRARLLGYAFLRRMGLRPASHRAALLAEVTASVLLGAWVGLGIALAAAALAHGEVDPVPDFRPAPLLRPAVGVFAASVAASIVVAVGAAALGQRRLERDDPVEVLRGGA